VGTSHSWLWFVDIFERLGFYDLFFLSENDIHGEGLGGLDVLVMSGGDTFTVAEGLGKKGAEKLENFIVNGGLYIGSCAGAYLPLNSSKEHLNLFNYVNVKITNLTKALPEAKRVPEKFCTPYGCSFIFHPVREEVKLMTSGIAPFKGVESLVAPLYGGPSMLVSDGVEVLAYYEGFTSKTVFLVDNEIARNIIIGNAAVVRKKMGEGHLYLFGPHFEHPHYPMANELLADVINFEVKESVKAIRRSENDTKEIKGAEVKALIRNLKRELSNSRIVGAALEMVPVHWLIGNKIYEPAKIRVFIESMWKRVRIIEKWYRVVVENGNEKSMVELASDITALLRLIRKYIIQGLDTEDLAAQLFGKLNILSTMFLDIYFKSKLLNRGCEA
ncbi:MAG TPA: BPL-N domain-containing protein, partial [Desulfatiglandales bacterium]|nr:BPL-N domain-containing protein [Desulfatiglandales bacterium]